jgi:MFS family permease
MLSWRSLAPDVEPLRHHRDFRVIWVGQFINNVGSQVTELALPFQLYTMTHSVLSLGVLASVQLATMLTAGVAAGALVDAIDRKRALLLAQAGMCFASSMLAYLAITNQAQAWELYVLAGVSGVFSAIDRPSRASILPRLVSRERVRSAIALNSIGSQTSKLLGPGLGGVLIASAGLPAAYGLDAISFGIGIAAILSISSVPPAERLAGSAYSMILDGIRYMRHTPLVMSALILDLNAMVFGFPGSLFPVLALDFFHVGATGLGLLVAARSVGSAVGAATLGWVRGTRHQGRVIIIGLVIWSVSIALFGLTSFFPLALLLLVVSGMSNNVTAIIRNTIVQLETPDVLRGRVSSLSSTITGGGPRLGDLEGSLVAAASSAQVSVVSGAVLSLIGAAVIVRQFPQLWAYDAQAHHPDLEVVPVAVVAAAAS